MDFILIIVFGIIGWISTTGVKTQLVRLGDIFLYGPFLIWIGYSRIKNSIERYILYFIGSATITYNLRNYIIIAKNKP